MAVNVRLRDPKAAVDEPESRVGSECGPLRCGCVEIGGRGGGVRGAIQMLGEKREVAAGEPLRGSKVQFAATRAQKGRIGGFLDQRVRNRKSSPSAQRITNGPR